MLPEIFRISISAFSQGVQKLVNMFLKSSLNWHVLPNLNNLLMLSNLMPLVYNKNAINYKLCHSIGDVLWNYSHGVIICLLLTHTPFINTHGNWNVCHSLSNYHAKLPDLSQALSDVTLSVLVTKVPLVVAHQITGPTLMKLTTLI